MRAALSIFKLLRYFSVISLFAFIIVTLLILGKVEATIFAGVVGILILVYTWLTLLIKRTDTIIHQQSSELIESQQQVETSYQREQQRRQLSDTLREIARIVSSSLDQERVLDLILGQLEHVTTYHRASVSLLEGRTLTLVAGRDKMGGVVKPYSFPADRYPLNAQVLTYKKPVLIPDVTKDDRWQSTEKMEGIRSFISAPLLVQDEPIGILAIGRLGDHPFTDEDMQTVFAFATQVAIAVRNAQLHAKAQERNRRLALLHDISLAVNSTLDLPTLLTAACQELVENFQVDHSGVMLFDDSRTYGEITAEFPAQDAVGISLPLKGYGAIEKMLTTPQVIECYDVQHDPLMEPARDVLQALGINSTLMIPLFIKGRVIGAFSLDMIGTQRQFKQSEIELTQTIASQLAMAIDNARLLERERARIEQEMLTARQIQKSLLPPEVPDIPGLDIAGYSQPAKEVGGDFYHFSVFDRQHLGVAVGDVSGKGLKAALMMTLSFGLLNSEVQRTNTPAALMNVLNQEIRPHTKNNKMNTALGYMTLMPENADRMSTAQNGQDARAPKWLFRAANAGLVAPLLRKADGSVKWLDVSGLPLGMLKDIDYTELGKTLVPGDLVVLSSDGVIEALDKDDEMFGFERLAASVAEADCQTAQTLLDCILDDLQNFTGDADIHDDLTMVVIKIT